MTKSCQKVSKLHTFFLECTCPEMQRKHIHTYKNINYQPAATCLTVNINCQPDTVLVDI